jgi:hypothetical protein
MVKCDRVGSLLPLVFKFKNADASGQVHTFEIPASHFIYSVHIFKPIFGYCGVRVLSSNEQFTYGRNQVVLGGAFLNGFNSAWDLEGSRIGLAPLKVPVLQ